MYIALSPRKYCLPLGSQYRAELLPDGDWTIQYRRLTSAPWTIMPWSISIRAFKLIDAAVARYYDLHEEDE